MTDRNTLQPIRHAFTLIELLVTIAICTLLIALLAPAVQRAREAARRTACRHKLHQIGVALNNYHDQCRMFPPAVCYGMQANHKSNVGSWQVRILPMIDQSPAYETFDWNCREQGGFSKTGCAPNYKLATTEMPAFCCPSDAVARSTNRPDMARTSYIACTGRSINFSEGRGVFFRNSGTRFRDIRDGASNTVAVSEVFPKAIYKETPSGDPPSCPDWPSPFNDARGESWARAAGMRAWGFNTWLPPNSGARECGNFQTGTPDNPQLVLAAPRSFHAGGVHVLFADGAVRFVSDNIDLTTWGRLGDKADGQPLGEF